MMNWIHKQNQDSWNAIADDWFGSTSLPQYGCHIPDEHELMLFPDSAGKRVLDIGCGSGHSLLFHANRGAGELWGLDISQRQLENAKGLLEGYGYHPRLFCSPMEQNPGLPLGYFDIAYSIYAIGWSTDLAHTLRLIADYLRPGGVLIFSWDHPFMHCVTPKDEEYILDHGYFDSAPFSFQKGGHPVTLYNHKVSDYINDLYDAGFVVQRMIEQTDAVLLHSEQAFSSNYYAPSKAKMIPLSFVIKAVKQ